MSTPDEVDANDVRIVLDKMIGSSRDDIDERIGHFVSRTVNIVANDVQCRVEQLMTSLQTDQSSTSSQVYRTWGVIHRRS